MTKHKKKYGLRVFKNKYKIVYQNLYLLYYCVRYFYNTL